MGVCWQMSLHILLRRYSFVITTQFLAKSTSSKVDISLRGGCNSLLVAYLTDRRQSPRSELGKMFTAGYRCRCRSTLKDMPIHNNRRRCVRPSF
ncbi:hypothetical protein VKT23_011099 [Stygiomarasmius scandens]|uniref:Secreted protein n=1 Tax=Marasmiellus scandens TaxID=2682957 RepID=A0ABR1JCH8_9AGAR